MHRLVTNHRASIRRTVVGNRRGSILSDHVAVEVHQPFARNRWRSPAHAMGGVAD